MMTPRIILCTSVATLLSLASCAEESEQASTQAASSDSTPSPFDVAPLGAIPADGGTLPAAPAVTVPDDASSAIEGGFRAAGLTFSVPEGWVSQTPSSSMRAAQFAMPSGEEGVPDAVIAVFASIGGTVDQNINRWIGQVSSPEAPPQRDSREIGDFTVHTVIVTGTFSAGMMSGGGAPESGTTLLGAVITGGPGGPIFLKATGPRAVVQEHLDEWESFITGITAG